MNQERTVFPKTPYFNDEMDLPPNQYPLLSPPSVHQEMQNDLDRETCSLQELEAQKQEAQERLEEMDQQKAKLEDMLNEVRIQCNEESQMVRGMEGSCSSHGINMKHI